MSKKKLFISFILALIFVVFYLHPLLLHTFYISHDGENHVARLAAYHTAFTDGQLIPRWAGSLQYGYGSPVLNFMYPLPGYIGSLFYSLGFSLEQSFKILAGVSFISAGITFFLWISTKTKDTMLALFASLFYVLAPYHFVNLYVRADIGELLSFVLVPLVFLMLDRIKHNQLDRHIIIGGAFYSLLILSHNINSLLFLVVICAYIGISSYKERTVLFKQALMLLVGVGLSAFFWIPAVIERRYLNSLLYVGDFYSKNFISIPQLFYSPWGFGDSVNKPGGLSPQLGLLHIGLVVISCIAFFKQQRDRVKILFFLLVLVTAIFFTLQISDIVWRHVDLLRIFQFPWRFIGIASFASGVLAFYGLRILPQSIRYVLTVILLIMCIQFVGIDRAVARSDEYYFNYKGTTTFHGETTTIWTAGEFTAHPSKPLEIIDGKGTIIGVVRKSNVHSFQTSSDQPIKILDNTVYFPGWNAYVDGRSVPIEFQDINHRGLITFQIPEGNHDVRVIFQTTKVRYIANSLSIVTGIAIAIWYTGKRMRTK